MFEAMTPSALLAEVVRSSRVVVVCGTGGVGKTTVSAALALGLAMEGKRALVMTIDPARRHGMVRLHRPGRDVAQAVIDRVMWMVGGHIEHVSALLPMDDPATAAAVPALEEAGMFFGGVIPNFEGRDTLLMEWVLAPALDTSRIQVIGDESERLKNYVVTRWGEASEAAKKQAS